MATQKIRGGQINETTDITANSVSTDTINEKTAGSGVTINALKLGTDTVKVDGIKDEDDMASDSATALATQQSIKAYVDNHVVFSKSSYAKTTSNILISGSARTDVMSVTVTISKTTDVRIYVFMKHQNNNAISRTTYYLVRDTIDLQVGDMTVEAIGINQPRTVLFIDSPVSPGTYTYKLQALHSNTSDTVYILDNSLIIVDYN